MQPFTLLIKPSGSDCNVDCKYCFYKDRAPEVGQGRQRMSNEVLERLVKDYLELRFPVSSFAWQGGEPTLMGLDFYKKVVELQKNTAAPARRSPTHYKPMQFYSMTSGAGSCTKVSSWSALVSTAPENSTITIAWTTPAQALSIK